MMTSSNGNIFRVTGNYRPPVKSPHKGQWRGALMLSFICAWIKGWVNNREAGDFRHHRAHCDVIVIIILHCHMNIIKLHGHSKYHLDPEFTETLPAVWRRKWSNWPIVTQKNGFIYHTWSVKHMGCNLFTSMVRLWCLFWFCYFL